MLNGIRTSFHTPCTLRTAGSLYRSSNDCSWLRVKAAHMMSMLLYSSVAGTCKENIPLTVLDIISGLFSCDNCDPFTIQPITPVVALQLKVAVDPNVALTDVGVLIKTGINSEYNYYHYSYKTVHLMCKFLSIHLCGRLLHYVFIFA